MLYNVSYEISALVFLAVIFIFHRIQYNIHTKNNMMFSMMVIFMFFSALFDLITCYTISYSKDIPINLNYELNIVYFCLAPIATYWLIGYMTSFLQPSRSITIRKWVNRITYVVYFFIVFSTPGTKLMFYFDDDKVYQHGSLYYLIYIYPLILILEALVVSFGVRKVTRRRHFASLLGFILIAEAGTIFQMLVCPDVMLNFFFASIAVLILMFTMETPDFAKLEAARRDLEISKKEAEEARLEAERANRAKSEFLANMSHEIRTPINGVLGIDEIALRENKDPAIEKYLLDIQDAGKTLLSLINDILDLSKVESGKMDIIEDKYEVEQQIRSIYNIIKTKVADKGLTLIINVSETLPRQAYGDQLRLRQIITNILNNAIKYTKEGSVTLDIDWKKTSQDTMNVIVRVIDTGIGIKEEDQKKLFQAFGRVDMENNKNVEGTGLGLRLTKSLLSAMHGTIHVSSVYGKGSTFEIVFPQGIVDEMPIGKVDWTVSVKEKESEETLAFEKKRGRVLVVDDVQMNLKVVKGLLKRTSLEVDLAGNGEECLSLSLRTRYDAILLDHMMPEMDGEEVLRRLKDNKEGLNHNTPVIALTANAITGAKEEYMAMGFDDYLSKPIDYKQMITTLDKYI